MRALRATVDGSYIGGKFNLSDWAKMKFRGVRYVNQDGVLTGEGGPVRGMETGLYHVGIGVEPPPGMIQDDEQEPTVTRNIGVGFGETPMDGSGVELLPANFFADPSIFFSSLSSVGFTGADDQGIAGEAATYFSRTL